MRFGYNTNGFPHHRLEEACEVIARLGYRSVAVTLDHHALDPFAPDVLQEARRFRRHLAELGLGCVVETGARFLLDPWQKHEPTLMSADSAGRRRRVDFLRRALEIARELDAEAVSIWSGVLREPLSDEAAFERLTAGLAEVIEHAERLAVPLAFEPEPGMWIDTLEKYGELLRRMDHHPLLGLTIDVGHVHCLREGSIPDLILAWKDRLRNVHIEDMKRDVHEHLMFGEGEIDFPPVLGALERSGYRGGVHVELSRHGHMAPEAARAAYAFLTSALAKYREAEKSHG